MKNIRLTARKVRDECDYLPLKRLGLSAEWLVKSGSGAASDPWIYTLTVCNAGTSPWKGVIRLSLPFVSKAPRFFLPGFMYGTNRGEAPLASVARRRGFGTRLQNFRLHPGGSPAAIACPIPWRWPSQAVG